MRKLILILSLGAMVACCVPASTNPDDNIDSKSSKKEVVEEKTRMATVTLYYLDGTSKVIEHEWSNTTNYDSYVRFVYDDKIIEHHGQYDISYDR